MFDWFCRKVSPPIIENVPPNVSERLFYVSSMMEAEWVFQNKLAMINYRRELLKRARRARKEKAVRRICVVVI